MRHCAAVSFCAVLVFAAGAASAQLRQYLGTDTLEVFVDTLVAECEALGGAYAGVSDFGYPGGGSGAAGSAMRNGTQDVAPQARKLSFAEYCDNDIPAAPTGEAALSSAFDPRMPRSTSRWLPPGSCRSILRGTPRPGSILPPAVARRHASVSSERGGRCAK